MAKYTSHGRITFGFEEVEAGVIKVKIAQTRKGSWIQKLTLPTLRNFVVKEMNLAGHKAEFLAKSPSWSPYKTGALIKSIKWISAKRQGFTQILVGALSVSVPYGRRQEFEHRTKGYYLLRALQAVQPQLNAKLANRKIIDEIFVGERLDDKGLFE